MREENPPLSTHPMGTQEQAEATASHPQVLQHPQPSKGQTASDFQAGDPHGASSTRDCLVGGEDSDTQK